MRLSVLVLFPGVTKPGLVGKKEREREREREGGGRRRGEEATLAVGTRERTNLVRLLPSDAWLGNSYNTTSLQEGFR